MTTSMNTSVQVKIRAVKRLQMSHSKEVRRSKIKRCAQISSRGRVHKSPQGSAGEGSPEPSSTLKQSAQQVMKPESEDSSPSSSLSSGSESSDEEKVHPKEMKELPLPPPRKHRKCFKSRSRSCTPTQKSDR